MRVYVLLLLVSACVVRKIPRPQGTQSFRVTVTAPTETAALGTKDAPLAYASLDAPFSASFHVEAIDWGGQPDTSYSGRLLIDAHPGQVYPNEMHIERGVGDVSVQLANSYGETRIWFEDCGKRELPLNPACSEEARRSYAPECFPRFVAGTLATGISPAILFEQPSISQVQATTDNASSPLQPRSGDRCAALADPRYLDTTNLTPRQIAQVPLGQRIPAAGNVVTVTAGRMIVTAITSSGFFVTDVSEQARSTGFNSLYVFNFGYPERLQVGDHLLSLTGTPAEFVGATQLSNPFWVRDPSGPFPDELPTPIAIAPELYAQSVGTSGANIYNALDMEKYEGALVCMDNLAVPRFTDNCDKNGDGGVRRGSGSVEQACESKCYENPECFEASSYLAFGNWGAHVTGFSEAVVKIGMDFAGAYPGFRPDKYMATPELYDTAAKAGDPPKLLAVTGNLVQVLGARPVWVIEPRGKDDVRFGGSCSQGGR